MATTRLAQTGIGSRPYAGFVAKAEAALWTDVAPTTSVWSDVSPGSSTWSDVAQTSTAWSDV